MKFTINTEISRSPDQVFAYLTDPAALPAWQGTDEVIQLTPGPVGLGTRFREVRTNLGKRIESVTEVSAYEPNRAFGVRIVDGPVPIDGDWKLEGSSTATQLAFTASGAGSHRLLKPILRRQFTKQHLKLKAILESEGP